MGRIFKAADDYVDFTGKSFKDTVDAAKAKAPGITWEELALFNWATKDPREVNRALMEKIGCKKMDDGNPEATTFDVKFGPGGSPKVLLPELWTDALSAGKDHVVTLKKKRPAPAVAITKLTRWFVPEKAGKDGTCEVEYSLEGIKERAEKVDFEVHCDHYVEEVLDSKGQATGTTKPSDTQGDAGSTHILRKRGIHTVAGVRAPTAKQPYDKWKGEAEATKGVLATTGPTVYIDYSSAPYTVLLRFYKKPADENTKLVLKCFAPKWKPPTTKGGTWDLDATSLKANWELSGDGKPKLTAGQLLVWDKDDKEVLRFALTADEIQGGGCDLAAKWELSTIQRNLMPYRMQVQVHSDQDEDDGLALAAMHTEVKAFQYDKVQFIGFHIKPGLTATVPQGYLGDADDDADIRKRCEIMIDAIKTADGAGVNASEKVLKVFMGPEFYFRGKRGAYNMTKIAPILDKLLVETGKFEYADWLFVYGSAIGEIAHEREGGNKKQHGGPSGNVHRLWEYQKHPCNIVAIDPDPGLGIQLNLDQPGRTTAAFSDRADLSINTDKVGWRVVQQKKTTISPGVEEMRTTMMEEITAFDKTTGTITLKSRRPFDPDTVAYPLYLLEPVVWVLEKTDPGNKTKLKVRTAIGSRIAIDPTPWKFVQGTTPGTITTVAGAGEDWEVTFGGKRGFKVGIAALEEPYGSEILNAALVQRGWPSECCRRQLKRAIIFKEYISQLDFVASGPGKVLVGGMDRTGLPVEGSRANLGRNTNPQGANSTWVDKSEGKVHTVGSEINISGEGGGCVITIDDIVFGVEVCLDHLTNRLGDYYHTSAQKKEPKVQVHLIPSWGMNIGLGRGEPCTVDQGLVFNVDGQRGGSLVRYQDGTTYSCPIHPSSDGPSAGYCVEVTKDYYCFVCTAWVPGPGNCSNLHPPTPLTEYRFCGKPSGCNGLWSTTDTVCPTCGFARPRCGEALKVLGAARTPGGPVAVAASPTHFDGPGSIVVYGVEDLPGPEEVV